MIEYRAADELTHIEGIDDNQKLKKVRIYLRNAIR